MTGRKRVFRDAPAWARCEASIRLSDGSEAQCGRWQNDDYVRNPRSRGIFCTQHGDMFFAGRLVHVDGPTPHGRWIAASAQPRDVGPRVTPRSCSQCGSTRPATKCEDCGSWVCDRPEYIATQYSSSPDEPSCQQEHAQSHRKQTP